MNHPGSSILTALVIAGSSAVAGEPQKLIPIGDSITQGGKLGDREHTYRWPLTRMLKDEGACVDFIGTRRSGVDPESTSPADWNDKHEGYYGAKTAEVRDRLAISLPQLPAPDIALVDLGTNDSGRSVDDETVKPLRDLVALLRKANPNVTVLLAQIPVPFIRSLYLHFRMNQLARELTTQASSVEIVDLATGWNNSDQTFDGVHPNLAGQRWMAERWLSAMRRYLVLDADGGCPSAAHLSASR